MEALAEALGASLLDFAPPRDDAPFPSESGFERNGMPQMNHSISSFVTLAGARHAGAILASAISGHARSR